MGLAQAARIEDPVINLKKEKGSEWACDYDVTMVTVTGFQQTVTGFDILPF